MTDAFQRGWDVSKIDFRLDGMGSRENYLGWSSERPTKYNYRVPVGRNEDGRIVGWRDERNADQSVKDNSWVNLGGFRNPHNKDIQRRIMETIMHETMHDADTNIGSPARGLDNSRGRPRFGNRETFRGKNESRAMIDGRPSEVIRRKDGMREISRYLREGGNYKFEGAKDELTFNPSVDVGSALTRDHNLAGETMAYIGEHPRARGTANLETMQHIDVSPIDTKWLADKVNWNSSVRDNKPKRIKNFLRNYIDSPRIQSDGKERENIEGFETPKTEQVRRNLVNALNDTAMTRMTQSGEFLENPKTSQIPGWSEGSRPSGKIRPMKPQIDAAKKETSKARRAINRHWKKIEEGKAPLPNSIDDLPKNIQELIGQQQIRAKLGLMRGFESDAVDLGTPMDVLERKYKDRYSEDHMSRDEQLNMLREYLKDISRDNKVVEPNWDRWGNLKDSDGYYIGDTRLGTEAFAGREIDDKTGEDVDYRDLGNTFGDRDTRWELYFPELREEFPELYEGGNNPYVVPKGNKPGNVYEIKPALENVKNKSKNFPLNRKPPSIPLKDWIEMYNYNLRENEKRQKNE